MHANFRGVQVLRIEKTVFLSYRRTNRAWALLVYKELTHHGYDVFFDFTGIASGDFERVILENIKARAHFIVLLTPSALERINEPGDWLRREIECALQERRNIVPLLVEGFDFGASAIVSQLTGRLADLKRYNALSVPSDYFDAAMDRLRARYLNVPLETVLHPASAPAVDAARMQQRTAAEAPTLKADALTANEWFERGVAATDLDEKVRCYSEAIRLQPAYADAYKNRGTARLEKGDSQGALADYSETIRLQPDNIWTYYERGVVRDKNGDVEGALADFSQAIRLRPDYGSPYGMRAGARLKKGDIEGALADYTEAIRLIPGIPGYYSLRAKARLKKGDIEGALADFSEAIGLAPKYAWPYNSRGLARADTGDVEGALADFSEAIRVEPNYAETYYNRAHYLKYSDDHEGAIRDYESI
jgi:tetratricopeptide (TPR) repeat protein